MNPCVLNMENLKSHCPTVGDESDRDSQKSSCFFKDKVFPASSPCAACKVLRRRCTDTCFLAPYFPPSEQLKFVIAHKVFGASNIVKALQELPESKRADAVSSMVYEANVRIHDPVYGCAGAISKLQKQLNDLQAELAVTQAELLIMQCQQQQQNDIASFFDRDLDSNWQPHCA
ncbi:LOB domain-containing protein 11 [Vitis vinifera]|uniref:LOB domain-containing protein 11 n=1 Tax=Vitis vinifera TaxID=29760 RepID=A0A438FLH8_VITVI|nr:LOB domain-containing protein 11 [Vitis vinifera]